MSVAALLPSWQLALESANRSPKTIKSYTASVRSLAKFLRDHDMPDDIDKVGPEHIRVFLVSERERTSPAFGREGVIGSKLAYGPGIGLRAGGDAGEVAACLGVGAGGIGGVGPEQIRAF
jgi:hypothetical protein